MITREKILVTGAGGQLGQELITNLLSNYGMDAVIASDINPKAKSSFCDSKFRVLDVLKKDDVEEVIRSENITQIFHLAAVLSANGEAAPKSTWNINMDSLLNILELARDYKLKIFWPSSIAVFGKEAPLIDTPQNVAGNPTTVYGISKLAGEYWCSYFHQRYGVDIRSLRFPGLIGYKTLPGGGTTDYAVDIYHKAVLGENFDCFLVKDRKLPMMYMPDAIKAIVQLMDVPPEKLTIRTSYNLSGFSVSPQELYETILLKFPDFKITYLPDYRDKIASSWPDSIDDSHARSDWNWNPDFDIQSMTNDMIENLAFHYQISK